MVSEVWDIRIVPAEECHIDGIVRCAEAAYRHYVDRIGEPPAPMIADFAAAVRNRTAYVVTDEAYAICGFAIFYPRDDHLHLENVAVVPDRQGTGLGKRLIEYCENAARDGGYRAVELYTNEMMAENLSLYPALGYVEIGRGRQAGFDRVFFRKTLE